MKITKNVSNHLKAEQERRALTLKVFSFSSATSCWQTTPLKSKSHRRRVKTLQTRKKPTTKLSKSWIRLILNREVTGEQKHVSFYIHYIYIQYKLIEADPRSVLRKMRHETGWQNGKTLRIRIPVRQFPSSPPAIGVTCFRTTMSCSFLAISSGICHRAEGWVDSCAPQG